MTDLATLEARKKSITDAIAALSTDAGPKTPFRKLPSSDATKLSALAKQLAAVNMQIRIAAKKAASAGA
jgi:hypothetical protein